MLKLVRDNQDKTALVAKAGDGQAVARVITDKGTAAVPVKAEAADAGTLALRDLENFERAREEEQPAARSGGWSIGRLFMLFVVLPTLATAIYLFAYASDQYRSEARFVVKSAQKSASTGLSALLESTGLVAATGDTYAVIDFLNSRDALDQLQAAVPFKQMVSSSDADFLARYPGYAFEDNFEALYDHYGRKVEVVLDNTTGIVKMSVLAFTPQDSLEISSALLDISEGFIDKLNAKAVDDSLTLAGKSIARAEARARMAQSELTSFRVKNGIVDPTIDVKRLSGLTEGLSAQLLELDQRIEALRANAPRSPQLNIIRQQRAKLVSQIGDQNEEMAGDGSQMLPEVIARFAELELETQFAAKALEAANVSFEKARQETLRKQLYITRIVEPRGIDDARDPRRFEMTAVVFALLASAFLILWLLTANMREHTE